MAPSLFSDVSFSDLSNLWYSVQPWEKLGSLQMVYSLTLNTQKKETSCESHLVSACMVNPSINYGIKHSWTCCCRKMPVPGWCDTFRALNQNGAKASITNNHILHHSSNLRLLSSLVYKQTKYIRNQTKCSKSNSYA